MEGCVENGQINKQQNIFGKYLLFIELNFLIQEIIASLPTTLDAKLSDLNSSLLFISKTIGNAKNLMERIVSEIDDVK
ncbi:MAG: hypothetical protein ABIA12_03335 [Candidatus Aenigmatarchaeota archaeon]